MVQDMSYNFKAKVDNAIKCSGSGFFKAGPEPPSSYAISDILSGTIDNPPDSGTTWSSNTAISYNNSKYTFYAHADYTFTYSGLNRMTFSNISFPQGHGYKWTLVNSLNYPIAYNVFTIGLLDGYYNQAWSYAYALVQVLKGSSQYKIRTGTGTQTSLNTVQSSIWNSIPSGTTMTVTLIRDSSDNIVTTWSNGTSTATVTTAYTDVFPSGKSWSDIDHIILERFNDTTNTTTGRPYIEMTRI